MPTDDELKQVAATLDATPELVPHLAELLADLWDLGSSPPLITSWLRDLGLPEETRVLDLGCGKGAVSLTLARELGFRVYGVDLFKPFVQEARARAEEWGLADRCRFEKGDLREVARSAEGYDVVVYASVGALGPLDACVRTMRGCVHEGGHLVIDEGFLAPGGEAGKVIPDLPGHEDLAGYEKSRRRLASQGDEILRENILSPAEMRAMDERYIRSISARAETLAETCPEDADLVRGYVDRQRRAAAAWERSSVSATWLLRRV